MEKNTEYQAFLDLWQTIMWSGIGISMIAALIFQIYYWVVYGVKKTYKDKYDFASKNEVNFIFYSFASIAVGVALYVNTLSSSTVGINWVWFAIRFFISVCAATLIIYVSNLILKFVYPARLAKKLNRLRYAPRKNPKTGHMMRLLSEEEEDVHLDEGMQAEEKVFSVDYDVWVDEVSGEVKIEKYQGYLEAQECDRCGFQTLRLEEEEIIKLATENEEGELIKHYKCSYCNRIKHQHHKIARLSKYDDFKLPSKLKFKDEADKEIVSIEMKLIRKDGSAKTYDFENTGQAREFLEEVEPGGKRLTEEEA